MRILRTLSVLCLLSLLALLCPAAATATYSPPAAVAYLKSRPIDEWSVMALSASGSLDGVSLEFLKNPVSSGSATDYEKRILAIAAAGQNPATYGAENFLAKLIAKFDGTQLGDALLLNDDIFGLLALAVGAPGQNAEAATAIKNYLASKQNADGGWGYAIGAPSDSNDTAMAISAQMDGGKGTTDPAIARALNFLSALRHADGGYSYDSSFGSDTASTAWVGSALLKTGAGMPPATRAFLESQQLEGGSFRWLPSDSSGSQLITAYALIALSEKTYPIVGAADVNTNASSYKACIFGSAARNIWSGTINFTPPAYAIDAVKEGAKVGGFTYNIVNTSLGAYVQAIASEEAVGVRGWFYAVNGTSPSVGAASYFLNTNDTVVWFYGQYGDAIPACNPAGATNPGTTSSGTVDLSVVIEIPTPPPPVISFVVTPSALNFGTLKPGGQASQMLNFSNTGNVAINITSQVQDGDTLFKDNLRLDSQSWSSWKINLPNDQGRNTAATLTVPNNFTNAGLRSATITFWATP